MQVFIAEIYDNWPAFVYIGMTIGFSICFLRERRAETEALKQIGARLNEPIDRMESLIRRFHDQ